MTVRNSSVQSFSPEADFRAARALRTPQFWLTMAACAVIYLPSLFWSLGLDQNIFAEIASLLLKGKTLYVDAWDVKPPNIFYGYAFFEWIFGPHTFAVRLSDYVAAMVACATMYHLPCSPGEAGRGVRSLASVLLALTLLSLGLADTAQTESYSLAFIIGTAALVCRSSFRSPNEASAEGRGAPRAILAGALIGIATFFKTTNAIFLLPIITEIVIVAPKTARRMVAMLVLGFLLWCSFQIGLLIIGGSLSEYLRIALSVFRSHPNEVSSFRLVSLVWTLWTYVDVWSIVALAALTVALLRKDRALLGEVRLPVLLLLAGLLSVIIQNKGWGYQYVVILPGLVPLVAGCSLYLFQLARRWTKWTAWTGAAILIVATLALTPSARRRIHYTSDALLSLRDHNAYIATLGKPSSLYYPPCTGALAEYLRSHTSEGDPIFIFGEEPGAYWRSDRMPAMRYVYALLFTSGVIPPADLKSMSDSLARLRPPLIVVERYDTLTFRGRPETSESLVATDSVFAPLRILLATEYTATDTVCENFLIYRRK